MGDCLGVRSIGGLRQVLEETQRGSIYRPAFPVTCRMNWDQRSRPIGNVCLLPNQSPSTEEAVAGELLVDEFRTGLGNNILTPVGGWVSVLPQRALRARGHRVCPEKPGASIRKFWVSV